MQFDRLSVNSRWSLSQQVCLCFVVVFYKVSLYPSGWLVEAIHSPGGPFYMIPGGIIGHEGGPCIILLLVPLGPVNILYLVWGTNSDKIFGPMGPLLGGTSFTVTGP